MHAAKVQICSECRVRHSSKVAYFDAVALRRLRLPQRPLAFSRLQAWLVSRCRVNLVEFPSSEARDDRTFSCLLHAGWSWGQRGLGGESLTPATLPFWSRCMSHFHLLVLTTLTQISFVSMG